MNNWYRTFISGGPRQNIYSRGMDAIKEIGYDMLGYNQYLNTKKSNDAQIAYDAYLREGNLRAYNDWQKNVGSKGRTIRYSELSYPGAIYRADTGIARSYYANDSARANFYGNAFYRTAGLYGIAGRMSRTL